MSTQHYIISFDPTDPELDYPAVNAGIKESGAFRAWWHHLPYVFLVSSDMSAEAIRDLFRPYVNGARFLVAAVDLAATEGNLTPQGWDWINRRAEADTANTNTSEHAI